MKKYVYLCLIFFVFISCGSTTIETPSSTYVYLNDDGKDFYEGLVDFYEGVVDYTELSEDQILSSNDEPEILYVSNLEETLYDYKSSGYGIMGITGFNGISYGDKNIKDALKKFARRKKSCVILYNYEYTSTTSYGYRRYDYSCYLLYELSKKELDFYIGGLEIVDLKQKDRINLERNTGCRVSVVLKNSPAFYANFLPGDIIIEINGTEIRNAKEYYAYQHYYRLFNSEEVKILRNGVEKTITLNL